MVALTMADDGEDRNELFDALADGRRRNVLRILDRISHARPAELATHLVAAESDRALRDVTPSETEQAQVSLTHVHIPKLVEADLVRKEGEFVVPTAHSAFSDPIVSAILERDAPNCDDVFESLASERRRVVLRALYRSDEPMDLSDLAGTVVEVVDGDSSGDVEDAVVKLHHCNLPKLEAAGLVTYDEATEVVTYEGHPLLDETLLAAAEDDAVRAAPSAD